MFAIVLVIMQIILVTEIFRSVDILTFFGYHVGWAPFYNMTGEYNFYNTEEMLGLFTLPLFYNMADSFKLYSNFFTILLL